MDNCEHNTSDCFAPVAVFVYNRPSHTKRLVESILTNPESADTDLYVFSDGPRVTGDMEKDKKCETDVAEVRNYIDKIQGFKNIHIIKREKNYGLKESLISGVTSVVNKCDSIIVLEDDLEVSPGFLRFMNVALKRYANVSNVYTITGYSFLSDKAASKIEEKAYFLPIFSSWGWATWSDRWAIYDKNATGWKELLTDDSLRRSFDFQNSAQYTKMMRKQMEEDIDSWAVLWYWSIFKKQGVNLYPPISFIYNHGFDGSGIHTIGKAAGGGLFSSENDDIAISFPDRIETDVTASKLVRKTLKPHTIDIIFGKVKRRIRQFI